MMLDKFRSLILLFESGVRRIACPGLSYIETCGQQLFLRMKQKIPLPEGQVHESLRKYEGQWVSRGAGAWDVGGSNYPCLLEPLAQLKTPNAFY